MATTFDYCILGSGLAGTSLAHELIKKNATVCIVDPNGVAGGASGTPLGLVNPATGRYASLSWNAELCYNAIRSNLSLIQSTTKTLFYKTSGVLRPALEEKIALRMKENFTTMDWPDGWILWMDEKEIESFHPSINCIGGGVWLPMALTVDIRSYLIHFVNYLKTLGLSLFTENSYSINPQNEGWNVSFVNGLSIKAKNIIFASGARTKNSPFWKDLPLIPVKGQVAILEAEPQISFDHAISALGYIASLDKKKIVIGGTYEHKFESESPDDKGLGYLLNRFSRVLPNLETQTKVLDQWSGIRASTPNRMPFLGRHPSYSNCFIFSGLGSKGLLYSAYLAQILANHILTDFSIPEEISIDRLNS